MPEAMIGYGVAPEACPDQPSERGAVRGCTILQEWRLIRLALSSSPQGQPVMKILLVDDHVLIREAMRGVLKELKSDAVVMEVRIAGRRCGGLINVQGGLRAF